MMNRKPGDHRIEGAFGERELGCAAFSEGHVLAIGFRASLPGLAQHFRCEVEGAGFRIDTQTTWDKPRELDEWMGIINEPARAAPLRTVVGALARAGADAGMGLLQAGGEIVFFHRWLLIAARKRRT